MGSSSAYSYVKLRFISFDDRILWYSFKFFCSTNEFGFMELGHPLGRLRNRVGCYDDVGVVLEKIKWARPQAQGPFGRP